MKISTTLSAGITNFLRERGRPGRLPTPHDRRSSRPRLEVLEDRTLLNTDVVTNTNASGPGSLNAAISSASTGDTIVFASGVTGTIALPGYAPNIAHDLDIEGPGAGNLTISGSSYSPAFDVLQGVTATITGLSIADNYSAAYSAIGNHGKLALTNCAISGNSGRFGGGISNYNTGTLTVTNCTIAGNKAQQEGGGIFNAGTLTLTNCTISGNSALFGGGGIFNNDALNVTNCTISGNTAQQGGGIYNDHGAATLANTIIAQNTSATGPDVDGPVTSLGYNLIGNPSGGSGFVATDLLDVNPLLGPLENNGGPTETMALLPGSPAITAGSAALIPSRITTDQRGAPRIVKHAVDIGAVEVQVYSVSVSTDAGGGSLRSALASADQFGGSVITFTTSGVISLESALPSISSDVQILGPGANELAVSGNGATTVFVVNQGVTATIAGLTIADGYSASGAAGGIYSLGTLTVTNCTLSGNSAPNGSFGFGGGICNQGTLTATNCTISGNSAVDGGGIANIFGTVTLTNCTLSGNSASAAAGGFGGGGILNAGVMTVTNCTISGNSGSIGGGIFEYPGDTTTIANTIVAGNTAPTGADIDGTVTSKGYNLIGNSSGGSGFTVDDLLNLDPLLGPLKYNGGPTETMALLPGSPAIATGNVKRIPSGITTDQRGSPRVVNGTVDIGAFESGLAPSTPTVVLEQIVTTQKKNKKGKPVGKPVFAGFALDFSTAMDRSTARLAANYQIDTVVAKRVKKKLKFTAAYDQSTNSVILTAKGKPTFAKGGQIIVIASYPNGLSSTAGVLLDPSDTVFTILAKAKGVRPA
jgi:hypothetical protein